MTAIANQQRRRWLEPAALAAALSVGLCFRLWQLNSIPGGLHLDEAIDLRQALRILEGARPIYVTEGWGREALYYYLVALVLRVVPENLLALRLTAVLCSQGVVLAAFSMARRAAGRVAAWFAAGWFGVLYWPVFASRFGVRHISMPLMLGITVLAFWVAWDAAPDRRAQKLLRYALAGASLGLTLYTYQPARFAPLIFGFFLLYLALVHRKLLRINLFGLVVFFAIALVIALPLVYTLAANSGAEFADREWTLEPWIQLQAGNPAPVVEGAIATAGMFSVRGDPLIAYNVRFRPVFQPAWTALFFYLGVAWALWRWRKPANALLLIWLIVGLLPTVVTTSAPNYNRAIGALAPVVILAALPLAAAARWIAGRSHPSLGLVPLVMGLVALVLTARFTWRDYFVRWPTAEDVAVQYNVRLNAIARYLEDDHISTVATVSSRHVEDADPYILAASVDRRDLDLRWVDANQALVLPTGQDQTRLFLASDRWIDRDLSAWAGLGPEPRYVSQHFSVIEVAGDSWAAANGRSARVRAAGGDWPQGPSARLPELTLPVSFQGEVLLVGIDLIDQEVRPDHVLTFITRWRVTGDGRPLPLALFAHLLDDQGRMVAQQDGLGYPPHSWVAGDQFAQVHHVETGGSLGASQYWIRLGLYERDTGRRWQVADETGGQTGDSVLIGPLGTD